MSEKIDVLNVQFDNISMENAVMCALNLIDAHRSAYVVTPNPEIVMLCREDPQTAAAVSGADLTIPDGIGIIYAAKLLKTPLKQKIPGIDFTLELLKRLASCNGKVFLFGGKPGVAEMAQTTLAQRFPGLNIVGTQDGYFTDDAPIIERINAAAPDLLLVCLGAPKQERWMHDHAAQLKVGLMIGGGGSLDVFAGTVERAPEAWQRAGLEWLYRLLKEPKRITRMARLPKFMFQILLMRKK